MEQNKSKSSILTLFRTVHTNPPTTQVHFPLFKTASNTNRPMDCPCGTNGSRYDAGSTAIDLGRRRRRRGASRPPNTVAA